MQHFAMVILLPFVCAYQFKTIESYEIGILLAASTAGELMSHRYVEPSISKFGTKWSIQLCFLVMMASSFALWLIVAKVKNSSNFMTWAFLSRLAFGSGAGLLRSVIMIARAQSKKGRKDV